jgi:hypothetical protein
MARRELIVAFDDAEVEFLLVGGVAAQAWGAVRPTNDLDLCVRWTPENLDRVGAALSALDAGMRIEGMDEPFPVPHRDGRFISQMELSTWRTRAGDVDILRNLPAPDAYVDFDQLVRRATTTTIDGRRVRVASLEDLIVSKETVDRPTDRDALPELRALRDQQQAPPPPAPGPRPSGPRPRP